MAVRDARAGEVEEDVAARIAVVGAGAAGIPLALRLAEDLDGIVLIESGGMELEGATQALYAGRNLDLPYYDLAACRLRYFGGTTNHWSGYSRSNDPIDYEARPGAGLPGWPVSADEIAPFVDEAAALLGIAPAFFDPARVLERQSLPADGLAERHSSILETKVFQVAADLRLGPKHLPDIRQSDRIDALLHLNLTNIALSPDGVRVERLDCATLEGRTVRVRADTVVLCCHAIENARLLLASNDVVPAGIGNAYDHVGRYFMDHVHLFSSRLIPSDRFPPIYNRAYMLGRDVNANIGFSEQALRDEDLLQYYCRFNPVYVPDEVRGARGHVREDFFAPGDLDFLRDVATVIRDVDGVARDTLSNRGIAAATPLFYQMEHRIEQAPNPDSRIILSDRRNALGVREADLQWRLNDHDVRAFARGQELIAQEVSALGYGRVQIEPIDRAIVEAKAMGHYHHIGTTRMSARPEDGVVDRHGRVHGVANLYVGGSSIFPTAGYSGPTMLIIAFALRLARHLKDQMA